jgi:hypothetical protein
MKLEIGDIVFYVDKSTLTLGVGIVSRISPIEDSYGAFEGVFLSGHDGYFEREEIYSISDLLNLMIAAKSL